MFVVCVKPKLAFIRGNLLLVIRGRKKRLQGLHINDELFVQGMRTATLYHAGPEKKKVKREALHQNAIAILQDI